MNKRLYEMYELITDSRVGSTLFNPYLDHCPIHDFQGSTEIRRKNLLLYLEAQYDRKPKDLWVAEAAGYKGARRTGIPLVPENLLLECSEALGTREVFRKATRTKVEGIRTANYLWKEIDRIGVIPLLWNTVLYHPHKEGNQMSNRKPKKHEMSFFKPIFVELFDIFDFDRIFCIGKVADNFVSSMGMECIYLRHPSMSGINQFKSGLYGHYLTSQLALSERIDMD